MLFADAGAKADWKWFIEHFTAGSLKEEEPLVVAMQKMVDLAEPVERAMLSCVSCLMPIRA